MSNNTNTPPNSAQITLFLMDNGSIDCETEWHFPQDGSANDQEIDTLITLIHGLSGFIHTRFYEVFKMGEAIEAGLKIKENLLERELFNAAGENEELIFTPDDALLERMAKSKEELNGKKKRKENAKIVDLKDFIPKDPKKLN
jgi:hypothetical protein